MEVELYDLIARSAREGLKIQKAAGEYPCGHNGPWGDVDTNVRTTAHWVLINFKAYEITGEERFLSSAIKACEYIIRKEQRPYGYTFKCRTNETGKNMCNGLIGQAWAIEPLVFIGNLLNKPEYWDVAKKIVLLHRYDHKQHVWNNTEINGKILGINHTLNQQVWFATLNLIIGKFLCDQKLNDLAVDFFINLPLLVSSFEERGLIKHEFNSNAWSFRRIAKRLVGRTYKNSTYYDKQKILSEGYLSFILYGLALAYEYSSEQIFWSDNKLKEIISNTVDFIINGFPFGWGEKAGYRWCYNPTGIEMAYALQVFKEYLKLESAENHISIFLSKQFEFYYDCEKNMLSKNTMDPAILSARLYEAVRLNNYSLTLSD
ncbi:MAG: hypothetical protein ABSC54_00515 [Smithellaceae bacterium]